MGRLSLLAILWLPRAHAGQPEDFNHRAVGDGAHGAPCDMNVGVAALPGVLEKVQAVGREVLAAAAAPPRSAAAPSAPARRAKLSNVVAPRDTAGQKMVTGAAFALNNYRRDGYYYLYMNDKGRCEQSERRRVRTRRAPGAPRRGEAGRRPRAHGCARSIPGHTAVCCDVTQPWPANKCWECCAAQEKNRCTWGLHTTIIGYRTRDFAAWENLGTVIGPGPPTDDSRHAGHSGGGVVLYNARNAEYVLWYNNFNQARGEALEPLPPSRVPPGASPWPAVAPLTLEVYV